MLLGIDVLLHLHDRADSIEGIAGALRTSPEDTQRVVDHLLQGELVSVATAGYSKETTVAYYSVTPTGAATTSRILDRNAAEVRDPPPQMTVAERFLFALANGRPPAQSEALLRLLDSVPLEDGETYRRKHARELARVAVSYATRALEADEDSAIAAAGLSSIPFTNEEDAQYIAKQLREEYAPAVASEERRAVIERAAAACNAADELRILTRGGENPVRGVSAARDINLDAYNAVAEQTAETMKAAVLPLGIDLYNDAEVIIKKLSPPPGAISPA